MLPYFVFDHFQIGPITFYTWGIFAGLGFCASYFWALRQAKKKNLSQETIAILSFLIFLGAFLGSRLGFLFQSPKEFFGDFSLLWRFEGGLMLWGGILGALTFGWIYLKFFSPPLELVPHLMREGVRAKSPEGASPLFGGDLFHKNLNVKIPPDLPLEGRSKKKISFWAMADIFAAPAALGIAIGRLGCFLLNDHQGAPTSLPWGILWPDGISRHPVALYESLVMFGLFFILLWLQHRSASVIPAKAGIQKIWIPAQGRDDKLGQLFLIFLISYAIIRFLFDFLRVSGGPLADPHWFNLTTSQWVSIIVAVIVCSQWFLRKK